MHTQKNFPYSDIVNLPRKQSATRKPMPVADRAAQFAPFAALTGYGEAIAETARYCDKKIEPDESATAELNSKLQYLRDHHDKRQAVSFTYFVPDRKKEGGTYVTKTGVVKKIQEFERKIVLTDQTEIEIEQILFIQGDCFNQMF